MIVLGVFPILNSPCSYPSPDIDTSPLVRMFVILRTWNSDFNEDTTLYPSYLGNSTKFCGGNIRLYIVPVYRLSSERSAYSNLELHV